MDQDLYSDLPLLLASRLNSAGLESDDMSGWARIASDENDLADLASSLHRESDSWSLDEQVGLIKGVVARARKVLAVRARIRTARFDVEKRTEADQYKKARLADSGSRVAVPRAPPRLPPRIEGWLGPRQSKLATRPDGLQRTESEAAEKRRWALELATTLKEANYPIIEELIHTANPTRELEVQSGRDRPRTIRNRLGPFKKFAEWIRMVREFQSVWPYGVPEVLDYLETRFDEPCARSVPESVVSALAYMEKIGNVAERRRPALSGAVQRAVQHYTAALAAGSPPKKKAVLPLLLTFVALELMVTASHLPRFMRVYAWAKLLKFWAALRSDDLAGIPLHSAVLRSEAWEATLERTKTSGPARKIATLPVFVSRHVYFAEPEWLSTGHYLVTTGPFGFFQGLSHSHAFSRSVIWCPTCASIRGFCHIFRCSLERSLCSLRTLKRGWSTILCVWYRTFL